LTAPKYSSRASRLPASGDNWASAVSSFVTAASSASRSAGVRTRAGSRCSGPGGSSGFSPAEARTGVRKLREEVLLLAGMGELPARNVGNLGLLLYADHLLAVELAGTLLLVATIGAVAIAHRR
jgi:hypothetical protein